jgi:hypothetical protein
MTLQSRQPSKKKFREVAIGKHILTFTWEPMFPERLYGKGIAVEGPYPVHKWYAQVDVNEEGIVERVR